MSAAKFREVFANPSADPIPVGIRSHDLVHAVRITGADPTTGAMPDGLEAQLRNAFANMSRSIENAGGTIDNIAHVSLFLADARASMPSVNAQWVGMFPDASDRPTYKFMTASLTGGLLVDIEYFAVVGARRRVIDIPGVAHTNPIPMAVRIGDYLFTSRVLPMNPASGSYPAEVTAQMDALFGNVDAVLSEAGMAWQDVMQGRLFLADMANLPTAERRWASQFPNLDTQPVLHPIHYNVGPTLLIMLELLAAKTKTRM
ncbi:MAG: RidA family protein [Rhodospirillales bacterium]|jgi:enamine deaminase RidA (YjgF/YER057c/UK114 family)|nr:RidA family protein [Rhodospirillales bacterium]